MPKLIKWKKPHKPAIKPFNTVKYKYKGEADKWEGFSHLYGKYALVAMEETWLSSARIEDARRMLVKFMDRRGKIWVRVFPTQAITKRTAETRLGAGKGNIEYWCAAVRPGAMLFEVDGVPEAVARVAILKAANRFCTKVRFVVKTDGPSNYELGLAGPPEKKHTQRMTMWAGRPHKFGTPPKKK